MKKPNDSLKLVMIEAFKKLDSREQELVLKVLQGKGIQPDKKGGFLNQPEGYWEQADAMFKFTELQLPYLILAKEIMEILKK